MLAKGLAAAARGPRRRLVFFATLILGVGIGCTLVPWVGEQMARLHAHRVQAGPRGPGWASEAWERLSNVTLTGDFCVNLVRLFSGETVYRFITGSVTPIDAAQAWETWTARDLITATLMLVALYGFYRRVHSAGRAVDVCLAYGVGATLLGFYAVAGPQAIAPHTERYGLCLVAPLALVLARGVDWWLVGPAWRVPAGSLLWGSVAALLLGDFCVNYFHWMQTTGGESHFAFRTAAVEPKQQAVERLRGRATTHGPQFVVCPEWWVYWPIAYLAHGTVDLRAARSFAELPGGVRPAGDVPGPGVSCLLFSGEKFDRALRRRIAAGRGATVETEISDYAGRSLLTLHQASAESLENN